MYDRVSPSKFKTSKTVIEEHCWIGAGVIILKGAYIGKNSIIGAGAIVKGNVPAHSLVMSDHKNTISLLKGEDCSL